MTRVLPRFPTSVRGINALSASTENGVLEIGIDPTNLAQSVDPTAPGNFTFILNSTTGEFELAEVASTIVDIATKDEAEAGVDNTAVNTPLRTTQQVDARLATGGQAEAGSDADRLMAPVTTAQAVQANVFPTRAELLARNLPAVQTRVRTCGRDVVGVGGGEFEETSGTPSAAGFTSPNGRKWEITGQNLNALQFGAKGDGVTDDAAALNALTAYVGSLGGGNAILTRGEYLVGSSIIVSSKVRLVGQRGAKLKLGDGANVHILRVADGAENWVIEGLEIDGNKVAQTSGVHGITSTGSLVSNGIVRDCVIHDCKTDGIGWASTVQTGIIVSGCHVYDNGSAGISSRTGTIKLSTFGGNVARRNGTHNIGATGVATHLAIVGNVCEEAGLADNITAYNDSNTCVTVVGNACRLGSNHGIHLGGDNLVVSGNVVDAPAQYGIVIRGDSSSVEGASVSGNRIENPGVSAIWFDNVSASTIEGNSIKGAGSHGILLNASTGVAVSGNSITGCTVNGIRTTTSGSDHSITGNTVTACGADGIRLSDVTDCVVTGNRSTGSGSGVGILESGSSDYNLIANNNVRGNYNSIGISKVGANTVSTPNLNAGTKTVASAATVTLPDHTDYIVLSGTTTVTSITASWAGRVIYVRASSGPVTLTDGGNLKLAGNVVLASPDMVTLVCDGVDWYQVAPPSDN